MIAPLDTHQREFICYDCLVAVGNRCGIAMHNMIYRLINSRHPNYMQLVPQDDMRCTFEAHWNWTDDGLEWL